MKSASPQLRGANKKEGSKMPAQKRKGQANKPPAPSAPAAPAAVDFSALTAEDTGESVSAVSGNPFKRLDGTPFVGWIQDTHDSKTAKRVTVPSQEAAKKVTYMLRLAARKLNLGVRIPQPYKTNEAGQVVVIFQGKPRAQHDPNKLRKPGKPRKGENEQSFQSRVRAWEAQSGKTWTAPAAK